VEAVGVEAGVVGEGALGESAELLGRALTMIRRIGDRDDEFRILTDLARLEIARGDSDAARECALGARDIALSLKNRQGVEEAEVEISKASLDRQELSASAL
jgi:hypothetical protein